MFSCRLRGWLIPLSRAKARRVQAKGMHHKLQAKGSHYFRSEAMTTRLGS